ncbi:hypothetical protein ACHQM5_018024 [Ranunculus cassubicifolius]
MRYSSFSLPVWMMMSRGGWSKWSSDMYRAKKIAFGEFVEKMLVTRECDLRINEFNLFDYDCGLDELNVCSWVIAALDRRVECICVSIPLTIQMNLPECMFSSNLRSLKLYAPRGANFGLPSSLCAAGKIKNLELDKVLFPDGDGSGQLVLECPVLESLKIMHCDLSNLKVLTLATPLLENLLFGNLFTNTNTSCEVRISTPNLKSIEFDIFSWSKDEFVVDYFMDNLSTLQSAYIHYGDHSSYATKRYSECLIKILHGVCNAQSLELSVSSMKILTADPVLVQRIPDIFHSLTHVTLGVPFQAPLDGVLSILVKFRHLETLTLFWEKYKLVPSEKEAENLSFEGLFNHLKAIKIKGLSDGRSELKLLEILLKMAIVLEDVSVTAKKDLSSKHDFLDFGVKLRALPRASLNATVHIIQKQQ